jgi:hypothetical protein
MKAKYASLVLSLLAFTAVAAWIFDMNMHTLVPCLLGIGILAAVLVADCFYPPPSIPGLAKKWLDENGYASARFERRLWRDGPFRWENGRFDAIFRIEIGKGLRSKTGWLKITRPLPVGMGRTQAGQTWTVILIWDDDVQTRISSSVLQPSSCRPDKTDSEIP